MRVLLKISWEALAWENHGGLNYQVLDTIGDTIKKLIEHNVEVGLVIGAGNFIRGEEISKIGIDRCRADNMGMLAININSLALADVLERKGVPTVLLNSFGMDGIVDRFEKQKAMNALTDKKVVLLGGGTGNPYFTTDTAGVLRALEIEADLMIKATKVDGVYDKDPMKFHDAVKIESVTYDEVLEKNLRVMDFTAISLAKENNLTLKVVDLMGEGALQRAIIGDNEGTTIHL